MIDGVPRGPKRMNGRSYSICLFVFLIVCGMAGCKRNSENSPAIRISGAWALYPMMVTWGEEYKKIAPNMRIDISAGGAGKGVVDALSQMTDIGMVSREIHAEETKQGAFYVAVVKDAVFPTMNSRNPGAKVLNEKGMKKAAFMDLFVHGKTTIWRDLTGAGPGEKVQVYTRSDSCGAAETWAKYLGGNKQEDLKGTGVYGDPGLAEAVKKDVWGIGYNNLNYLFDAKTGLPVEGLHVVPIDVNENGKVDPEEVLDSKEKAIKAVVSGIYPAPPARDLYLVTKDKFRGQAKEFIKWILKDGQKYVEEVGYIRLSDAQIRAELERLEK
jgi:phosphate transport system substrate-binding protein